MQERRPAVPLVWGLAAQRFLTSILKNHFKINVLTIKAEQVNILQQFAAGM
jgi:hypothetical protein